MEQIVEEAKKGHGVKTLLGRRRFLPDINSKNYAARQGAERMARNTPIQGTAADIIKKAMIRVHRRLADEALASRMVLTVHDELVLEVPLGEEERAKTLVVEEMMAAESLKVPLVVDVGWGPSWDLAH
jgi:DNA polymerase-1